MYKSEMTEKQLQDRSMIIEKLAIAGWKGTVKNELFQRGLWLDEEASMDYQNQNMNLSVGYSAKEKAVYLTMEDVVGRGVNLTIYFNGNLKELLETIMSIQDKISSETYKICIREILRICPSTYLYSTEKEQMIKLVDDFN